jgi:hypothetical protein
MKSNLNIRTIVDTDNNKVYLSVEGKIENGSKEEKEDLRNKLVKAFSIVLGLEPPLVLPDEGATVSGFETVEEEEEDKKIRELIAAGMEPAEKPDPATETVSAPEKEEEPLPKAEEKPEPAMKYGAYKGKKPSEVVASFGEKAFPDLLKHVDSLKKNIKKYPANQEVIDAIYKTITDYKDTKGLSLTFQEMDWRIRNKSLSAGDMEMDAVNSICAALGETYDNILAAKNMDTLSYIYKNFMEV